MNTKETKVEVIRMRVRTRNEARETIRETINEDIQKLVESNQSFDRRYRKQLITEDEYIGRTSINNVKINLLHKTLNKLLNEI